MKMYFLECKCDIFLDDFFFLFCETSPISWGVVQGWIKTGILKQIVLWWWTAVMQMMERAKTKKLEAIAIIIIIIIYVVMVLMMGLHWRSKWATHTVAGCWLSLLMPCHHDCIPVISKIYYVTTVYQSSQKHISSRLYTSHLEKIFHHVSWFTTIYQSSQQKNISSRLYTSHLKKIFHHDYVSVISKRYFITTAYQSSQKYISSWLYTTSHLKKIFYHDCIPVTTWIYQS